MKKSFGAALPHVRSAMGAVVLASLVACGGGGGGGSGDQPTTSGGGTSAVSGVASKGLLKDAIVKAYAIDANGTVTSTVVAQGRTDTAGAYHLTGIPTGQMVLVKVTADSNTRMADEVTGTDITVPPDFTLRAVQKVSSSSETVLVTPYSEMAATIAESGGFTEDKVTAATAQVKMFAGDAVFTQVPQFDSQNKPTNPAAAALAAVANLAAAGTVQGCTGITGNTAAEAQAAKVKCVVEQMATRGTDDTTLASQLNTSLTSVTSTGYTGEAVPPISQTAAVTISDTAKSGIAAAKALISSVRNTVQAMSDRNSSSSLVSRAKVVGDVIDANLAPLDGSTQAMMLTVAEGMTALDDPDGWYTDTGAVPLENNGALAAGCQFYSNNTFSTASNAPTSFLGCRVTHKVVATTGSAAYAIQHQIRLTKVSNLSYTVATALIKQTGTLGQSGFTRDDTPPTGLAGSQLVRYTSTATRVANANNASLYDSFTLAGDTAPGVDASGAAIGTKQHVNIAAAQSTTSSNLTKLALSGVFDLYNGSALLASVGLQPGSYLEGVTRTTGVITGPSSTEVTGARGHLIVSGTASSGAKVVGTLDASNFLSSSADGSGGQAWPKSVTFTGYVTEADGVTKLFDGTVSATMPRNSSVNTLGYALTLQGVLVTNGTGTVTLSLTLAQSSTTAGLYTFSGSYVSGSDHVVLSNGHFDESVDDSLTFTVSDAVSGVGFHFAENTDRIEIKKDTTLVGLFVRSTGRLVFADNSYQQF